MSRPKVWKSKSAAPAEVRSPSENGLVGRLLRLSSDRPDLPGAPAAAGRARKAAAVGLAVLCCLLARLPAARTLDVDNDESTYTAGVGLQYAEYLRAGDVMGILRCRENYEHPPLVKLIYGAAIAATGQDKTPEQVISVCRAVAVLFACLGAALLALLSPWAGLLFAVHSWQIYFSSKGWLDSVTVFFTIAAFYFFVRADQKWNRAMVLSALFLGAGVGSKYVNGLFAATLFPFLVLFFRRRPRYVLAYVGLSALAFFALDPALWLDPVGNLKQSLTFHQVQGGTALYQRFLERYGGDRSAIGQFVSLWGNISSYQPERLAFGLDRVVLVLGFLGLPFLFRRNVILVAWFAAAALFLLLYPIKYPHYSMIFIPALALSGGEALRRGVPWALQKLRVPLDHPWLARLPGEAGMAALAGAALASWAAVFGARHWRDGRDDLRAYNSFAYTLTRLGRAEEARAIFARSGQGGGELTVASHLNIADLLIKEKKYVEARVELAEVLRLDPESAEGHALLGNTYLEESRLDEALSEYQKANVQRLTDPSSVAMLWLNIGSVQMKRNQPGEAIEPLEKAIRLKPTMGEAHYLLGLARAVQGDLGAAERELGLGVENGVGGWKIHHDLGVVYAREKKYAEAIASWEKALRADPQNAETRQYLESARRLAR
jgi:tetratricopeptide (TPR) repeat protein